MRSPLVTLALLMSACGSEAQFPPDVFVQATRTLCVTQPETYERVAAAVDAWEVATGADVSRVSTSELLGCVFVRFVDSVEGADEGIVDVDSRGRPELRIEWSAAPVLLVHEVGHVMGLEHVEGEPSVMNEEIDPGQVITEADAQRMLDVLGG